MSNQDSQLQSAEIGQLPQSFGNTLGLMYKRWVLDCITYLGHAVSLDFSNRPEFYKQVSATTANQLTEMQGRYGFDPNFPNDAIRSMLMKPVFGESDGHGSRKDGSIFQATRWKVLAAADGFSMNAQPISFPMHRERIRNAIIPFKRFMEDLEGASLNQTESRMRNIFNAGASILRTRDVSAVFGVNEPIDASWPLQSDDPAGAKLIENITKQLPNISYGLISRDHFQQMQRIGEKGLESIRFILETDIESIGSAEETLDRLTSQLYPWGSEMGLMGGVIPQDNEVAPRMIAPQPNLSSEKQSSADGKQRINGSMMSSAMYRR